MIIPDGTVITAPTKQPQVELDSEKIKDSLTDLVDSTLGVKSDSPLGKDGVLTNLADMITETVTVSPSDVDSKKPLDIALVNNPDLPEGKVSVLSLIHISEPTRPY